MSHGGLSGPLSGLYVEPGTLGSEPTALGASITHDREPTTIISCDPRILG
jgi:hypothetical protein